MVYRRINPKHINETDMRTIWKDEYCQAPIVTFDSVEVRCYEDMFDHIFYESANNQQKDKSILSLNRLQKIYWIKETLQDATAILKKGWNSKEKKPYNNRRVAIVKGNYVVIIRFTGLLKAKLVTAYEKNDIENILNSEDFVKTVEFFGDET